MEEELRQQLDSLSLNEIVSRIDFLAPNQRSQLKSTMLDLWLGKLKQDEQDRKHWKKVTTYYWMTIPLMVGARLGVEYIMLKGYHRRNSLLRAMAFQRGLGLGMVLLIIPIHQSLEYTMRIGYKHFILAYSQS